MYAIIQLGSLQYRVSEGDIIDAQELAGSEGKNLTVDKVLLVDDGASVKVGQPFLKDVKVTAKVIDHHLGDKAVSFKHRRRKNSKWKKGHRQRLISLQITKIALEK